MAKRLDGEAPRFKNPRYKRPRGKLTAQQQSMIDAYFENGFNRAAAMREAGYTDKTAMFYSGKMFDKPHIKAEIERRQGKLAKKHELTQDFIIEQFMKRVLSGETLAKFKKIDDDGSLYWDFKGAAASDLALVTELGVEFIKSGRGADAIDIKKFKVKEPDVQAALMALARHLGLFNDKLEVSGSSLVERIQAGRRRAYGIPEDEQLEAKRTEG